MLKLAVCFSVVIMLSGCDSVIDCLDNDGPEFDIRVLDDAILNQVYLETVRASVRNEPRDDRFIYRFTLSGPLPAGLSYRSSGRTFIIDGTPTASGLFPLSLQVAIDDGLSPEDSGLCFRTRSENYRLFVREI